MHFVSLLVTLLAGLSGEPAMKRANTLYHEGSYALAHEAYAAVDRETLDPPARRFLDYRLADTAWRAEATGRGADSEKLAAARSELEELARESEPDAHVRLEALESLGDFHWSAHIASHWGLAWEHYRQALEGWAASRDLDTARERFLRLLWKASGAPAGSGRHSVLGSYGNQLPLHLIDDGLRIARAPGDRARLQYLRAMTLRHQAHDPAARRRTRVAFDKAIEAGRGTDWHDDALFQYGTWLSHLPEPDFDAALAVFRELVEARQPGESRYYSQAEARIRQITSPELTLAVPHAYRPGDPVEYALRWRNVEAVELTLSSVSLPDDLHMKERTGSHAWIEDLSPGTVIDSWRHAREGGGAHEPRDETRTLERKLAPGAYLLEAKAGPVAARDLILVTDLSVVTAGTRDHQLVFVADAMEGAPVEDVRVVLWSRARNEPWERSEHRTDADGLVVGSDFPKTASWQRELIVAVARGDRQSFAVGSGRQVPPWATGWKVFVHTDRPAYRPGDTVRFKVTARRVHHPDRPLPSRYTVPAGQTLDYKIRDARGAEIAAGSLRLNEFGSAWDELVLEESSALGEYRIEMPDVATAVLFRMEEYKLPEFRVDVEAPERTFRPEEEVEAVVHAEYYFGGAVSGAEVAVSVYQEPIYVIWHPPTPFPWLRASSRPSWGGGQIIHQETLTTDAEGRALIRFTPSESGERDFRYRFEARVTDSSRREVAGSGSVTVTHQRYFAFLHAEHRLPRPGDRVEVTLKTLDGDDRPVAERGEIVVTRIRTTERWITPLGKTLEGKTLERERRAHASFPPGPGWRPDWHYEKVEIRRETVRTGEDGEARVAFEAKTDGHYTVEFLGDPDALYPVKASASVWVAGPGSDDLGHIGNRLQILVDADTVRTGATTPVMISTPVENAWVLFTVETEQVLDWRLVHVRGRVKLLEIPLEERHVPNVFLRGIMVRDGRVHMDRQTVAVPPDEKFLDVTVEAGEAHEPGSSGTVRVRTVDADGNPVRAEVALSLVDEAIYAIQEEYAPDPRELFYGEQRQNVVSFGSSFRYKSYRPPEVAAERRENDDLPVPGRSYANALTMAEGVAAPAPMADMARAKSAAAEAGPPSSEIRVRSDFRSTALWLPDLATGADGEAEARVSFPDSLTAWRATARATGGESRFGVGNAETRTDQPMIVRLQAPRFFVVGDETVVSAVVNNRTDETRSVRVELAADGLELVDTGTAEVTVPASGEARVDWKVRVREAGRAELTVRADGRGAADAMVRDLPVHPHGIEKLVAESGKTKGDEVEVVIDLPDRRPDSTALTVRVAPSIAVAMLDALPYLIDYPYGCTEQTMSRFLPAVVVARALERTGIERREIEGRLFGGIENPRAGRDLGELDRMVRQGLARLADFQHPDGGWGWWKEGVTDPFMSAYVVWGLGIALEADVRLPARMLDRGRAYLEKVLVEAETRHDLQAFVLHALATTGRGQAGRYEQAALDNLWNDRDRLSSYARALLTRAAHRYGARDRAEVLSRNLFNGVRRNGDTAHWGASRSYRRWHDGPVEATSLALMALLEVAPGHELVEPAVTWLVRNRRGAQWSNTRDSAIAVLALTEFLVRTGELDHDLGYEISVNGERAVGSRIDADRAVAEPARHEIDPGLLRDGKNRVRILRTDGDGPLYWAVETTYFSLEEPITPAGNEIRVRRRYDRMALEPTLLRGYVAERHPLEDRGSVASGERVEVILTVESDNDYEYLVFEDLKPAGLEAVQVRSGEPLWIREVGGEGRARQVYQELRDRKVALFVDKLPQGTWELRYELRAEVPGRFHALPVLGHAMYVPEVRCNGREIRIDVHDP